MSRYKLAFQLYSARNFPPLEPQLAELAAIGYDAVEPWLPAYGDDPLAFRRMIDQAGLACYGFHMPLVRSRDEWRRFADIARTIGARLMIPAWIPPEERGKDAAGWRRIGDWLAEGAVEAGSGLTVAWHNHDFEFALLPDGSRPIDHLRAAAGPKVGFEIDVAWVVRGGADPAAELKRYADRIVAIQVKDTGPLGTTVEGGWTATGDGIVDWKSIWPLFSATKADHLIMEHDEPADWKAFARRSFNYVQATMRASERAA